MNFLEHMRNLSDMLVTGMKLADDYNNPTGKGDFRELQLINILRDKLPENLVVSKGEVFDSDGNRSPEFDIIIHLRTSSPKFFSLGDRKVIPCEDVIAVGEVKSSDSEKAFKQFKDALEKLNGLNRYYKPTELFTRLNPVDAAKFNGTPIKTNSRLEALRPIIGFFFAYRGASAGTLIKNITALSPFPDNNIGFFFPNHCQILKAPQFAGWVASPEAHRRDVLFMLLFALLEYCRDDVRTLNVTTDFDRYIQRFVQEV